VGSLLPATRPSPARHWLRDHRGPVPCHGLEYGSRKRAWIQTYMASESVEEARKSSNFWICPLNTPEVNIEGRLQYLRERKLNLFLDAHSADR